MRANTFVVLAEMQFESLKVARNLQISHSQFKEVTGWQRHFMA